MVGHPSFQNCIGMLISLPTLLQAHQARLCFYGMVQVRQLATREKTLHKHGLIGSYAHTPSNIHYLHLGQDILCQFDWTEGNNYDAFESKTTVVASRSNISSSHLGSENRIPRCDMKGLDQDATQEPRKNEPSILNAKHKNNTVEDTKKVSKMAQLHSSPWLAPSLSWLLTSLNNHIKNTITGAHNPAKWIL